MKRGLGIQTARALNVHPSTVSRNKERSDVVLTAKRIEVVTILNKNDLQRADSNTLNNERRQ